MIYIDPPVSPYNPDYPDYEPQTTPLDQVIRDALFAHTIGIRVCLPAIVTIVLSNQMVNVQPALQVRYIDADPGPEGADLLPIIQNVPVSMPMGKLYSIKLPIAPGDTGYVIFSDRSLDNWLGGAGQPVDPGDCRQHDIADAIFVPGLVPFSLQTEDTTPDIVFSNGAGLSEFRISPLGGFALKNETTELIQNLINLVQTLSTASTVAGGPFVPSVVATLTEIAANLETLTAGEED